MKALYRCIFVVFFGFLFGCQQQQQTLTEVGKEAIQKEIKNQFNQLISAVNQLNAAAWSENYSKDEFLSTICATDYYASRSAWVDVITKYFSMRERQNMVPAEVRVTPLTPNLALMTSEEYGEILLKEGKNLKHKHVFTMLWKKEQAGWKILHSHESWNEM